MADSVEAMKARVLATIDRMQFDLEVGPAVSSLAIVHALDYPEED